VTEISTTLRQEVERKQIISFARFMELALYCPNSGYYEQDQSRIGIEGDFYTNVSTGPLFGALLASRFCQWLEPGPNPVQLVEAGAHDGRLASDILTWIQARRPDVFIRLAYYLLEPSQRRRDWQKRRLADFAGTIRWVNGPGDLTLHEPAGVNGVIFSNELLDAFPVRRLRWVGQQRRWNELGVGWDAAQDQFVWRLMPPMSTEEAIALEAALASDGIRLPAQLKAVLPDGYLLDWSASAGQWWLQAARALRQGVLMTIDYGLAGQEILLPNRQAGTLRGYYRHRGVEDLLARPGQQDLTAGVNFEQLRLRGEGAGLRTQEFTSQSQFLARAAAEHWPGGAPTPSEGRQFQTLTHPDHLGRAFRVLVQSR